MILCQPIATTATIITNINATPSSSPLSSQPPPILKSSSSQPKLSQSVRRGTGSDRTIRAASSKSRVYYMYDFLLSTYPFLFQHRRHGHHHEGGNNNDNKCMNNTNIKINNEITPQESSSSSSIVILDVAGGRGDLSWYINSLHSSPQNNNNHTVTSIVIDPRNNVNHTSLIRSAHYLECHPDETKKRNVPGTETFQPLALLLPDLVRCRDYECQFAKEKEEKDDKELKKNDQQKCSPKKEWKTARSMGIHFDDSLVHAVRAASSSSKHGESGDEGKKHYWEDYWKMEIDRAKRRCYHFDVDNSKNNTNIITNADEAFRIINNVDLIVGFHPDQATEAIVDLALHLNVPYCIVPCCVFPKEFPNRRINDEKEEGSGDGGNNIQKSVRDHASFLLYLRQKDDKVRNGILDFPFTGGKNNSVKNVVLYTLPEDMRKDLS